MPDPAPVGPDAFPSLAAFIAELNLLPEHHVGYLPMKAPAVLEELGKLEPTPERGVFSITEGEVILGVLAREYDAEIGRAWMYGPWCREDGWEATAAALHDAVAAGLPDSITTLELWCDLRNERVRALAGRLGYGIYKEAHVLTLPRSALTGEAPEGVVPAAEPCLASLYAIHDRHFPGTYYTGPQLVERAGPRARLSMVAEGDRCLGYSYIEVQPDQGGADIHFLAVDDTAQGRGIGRKLLSAGLHWIFSFPGIDEVGLVAEPGNDPALGLYEKVGFSTERRTVAFRRPRNPGADA